MRKTYIAPNMIMVKHEMATIIAASNPKVFTDEVSASEAGTKGNDVGNIWDDDDE